MPLPLHLFPDLDVDDVESVDIPDPELQLDESLCWELHEQSGLPYETEV